ncbi:MAG: hypothetical protein M3Y48_11630 [Actinomycetota bacterium]|nr:hypothetical protein [Actinomycetota bacterium]
MNERDLPAFLHRFFTPFSEVAEPLVASLELARHLVCGAVAYARQLGFEPAPDFEPAAGPSGPGKRPARSCSDATVSRSTSAAPSTSRPGWSAP